MLENMTTEEKVIAGITAVGIAALVFHKPTRNAVGLSDGRRRKTSNINTKREVKRTIKAEIDSYKNSDRKAPKITSRYKKYGTVSRPDYVEIIENGYPIYSIAPKRKSNYRRVKGNKTNIHSLYVR